jgi:Zn-finger nucleic acid-binding protein
MNCPVCKTSQLISTELESNLSALKCLECGGNWIHGAEYWKWLEKHGPSLPEERAVPDEGWSPIEPSKYLDCPECRFRMLKYLVGHGLNFSLDHCEGCKGIWLDRNEWETLKKRNLHDDMNSMLTSFWQTQARRVPRKQHLEQVYIRRFGADDYAEIKKIRAWLETRQNKQGLLAYLTDKDPFDV